MNQIWTFFSGRRSDKSEFWFEVASEAIKRQIKVFKKAKPSEIL